MLKEQNKIQFDIDNVYQDFLVYKYHLNMQDCDMKKLAVYKKYKRTKKFVKVGLFVSLMLTIVPGLLQYNHILFLSTFYPNMIMATFVGCITAFFSFNAIENLSQHKREKIEKEFSDKTIEKEVMDYITEKYGKDFVEFLLIKYKMQIPYSIIPSIEREMIDMTESENIRNKAKNIMTETY